MTTKLGVDLNGPHILNRHNVAMVVSRTSPGVYVLSRQGNTAHYVGRFDNDLRSRLLTYVDSGYRRFWYAYATTPKDSFEKECVLFHQLGGAAKLDNKIHPQRPDGCTWRCPVCRIFG